MKKDLLKWFLVFLLGGFYIIILLMIVDYYFANDSRNFIYFLIAALGIDGIKR